MYERLALWMRYFFVLLALAFVVRAWVITVRDNRRARAVRAWLPETGTIGEWLVLDAAGEQARKGVRYPILNEGMIGSGRRSDVRLYHPMCCVSMRILWRRKTGCAFALWGSACHVESQVGGTYHPADGYVDMADGDVLVIGGLRMMLTLFDAHAPRHPVPTPPPISGRTRGRHATRAEEEPFEGDPFYDEERGDDPFGDADDEASTMILMTILTLLSPKKRKIRRDYGETTQTERESAETRLNARKSPFSRRRFDGISGDGDAAPCL